MKNLSNDVIALILSFLPYKYLTVFKKKLRNIHYFWNMKKNLEKLSSKEIVFAKNEFDYILCVINHFSSLFHNYETMNNILLTLWSKEKYIFIGTSEKFHNYDNFKSMCLLVCFFYSHLGYKIQFIQDTDLALQDTFMTLKEHFKLLNYECIDEIKNLEDSDLKMIFCIEWAGKLDFYNYKCPNEILHSNQPFVLMDYSNMIDVTESAGFIHTINTLKENKCKFDIFEQ